MVSAIISRTVILLFGILYPAYASYKAVKTKNVKEYVKWMMYWIVFAFFTCLETLADVFVAWLPFYYELKILFVLWLLSPATKGSSILYRKFVHPQLAKREKEIDAYINKASDQGYAALLALGSRGFNYATNVVLNTAIKGQSKIADHLKKSYSLNDLSNDDDEQRLVRRESSISELDDETDNRSYEGCKDNRLLEESYQREMQELGVQDSVEEEAEDGDEGKIRRRRSTKSKEAELHPVDESEELDTTDGKPKSKKGPTYSHKEAYHYGTLPRNKTRSSTRTSVKKVIYD